MVEGAKKLGFDSEALEGDFVSLLDALENQSFTCPFIATVVSGDLLHYVVVYKVTKKLYYNWRSGKYIEKNEIRGVSTDIFRLYNIF